jgi:hypothetical protein
MHVAMQKDHRLSRCFEFVGMLLRKSGDLSNIDFCAGEWLTKRRMVRHWYAGLWHKKLRDLPVKDIVLPCESSFVAR